MQTTLGAQPVQRIIKTLAEHQVTISRWVLALLIALIAWQLGKLVWMVSEPSSSVGQWRPAATSTVNPSTEPSSSTQSIVDANLFGQYQRPQADEQPKVVDAPKTNLNLILVGVVSSSNPDKSLAVISNKNVQETVGVGELITGTRAKIVSVLPDRIIIENAGRDETLMLEGISIDRSTPESRPTTSRVQSNVIGNNAQLAELGDLDSIKQAILENPQQFLKYIRLSQVNKDGELQGYRVRPGRERALFDSVGLQDGDLAVELNGIDLTDKSAMGSIMQSFNDMTEVNLTVERDGQRYDIYIQF